MCPQIKGHASLPSIQKFGSIKHHLDLFTLILLGTNINPSSFSDLTHLTYITKVYIMDATYYCVFAIEYLILNAAAAALIFWTADLKPHILSDAIE